MKIIGCILVITICMMIGRVMAGGYIERVKNLQEFITALTLLRSKIAFGQEVQMDACEKMWFGGIVSYLHLAVDKGTKKVLFGWFEYEELTRAYFILLYNLIINYGIPLRIKTEFKPVNDHQPITREVSNGRSIMKNDSI